MQKSSFLTILFLTATLHLMAQTGRITGRVLDAASRKPLVSVTIKLIGKDASLKTDKSGVFVIPSVTGKIILLISHIGYRAQTVTAIAGDSTVVISMQTETSDL